MSGTGPNLPIRIQVEGGQAAEAVFNSVAATGERAMQRVATSTNTAAASGGNLRQAVGSAGFQLQDFAVQVQGGTSALTALSQQGSQFLGVFGPAGAIAGAVLTVGILAASFFELGKANEDARLALEAYTRAMDLSNTALQTGAERSREQAALKRREAEEALGLAIAIERENVARINAAGSREADRLSRIDEQVRQGRATPENAALRRGEAGQAAINIANLAEAASQRLTALQGQLDALGRQGVPLGNGQFGPTAPPSTPRAAAGRSGSDRQGVDVNAAIEASGWAQSQRALNAYNQELNLNAAGLSGAAGALAQYERNMGTLNAALANGVLTEAQFATEVEASSLALAKQMEAVESRTERASGAASAFNFTFNSALEDAIIKGGELSNVLKALEQDIARMILRAAVTQPLGNAVSAGTNLLGKVVSGFLSGGSGGGAGATVSDGPKFRADGGPVFAGNSYLVGERGPELITMGAAGTVTPNAGNSPTFVYNIDARGADASVVPRLRAEMEGIAARSLAQFADSIQRGGAAARLVGRR